MLDLPKIKGVLFKFYLRNIEECLLTWDIKIGVGGAWYMVQLTINFNL